MRCDLDDHLIVFDWNGTVMDDAERAAAATNKVLAARGRHALDIDQFRTSFVLPLRTWLLDLGLAPEDTTAAEAEWNAAMAVDAPIRVQAQDVLRDLRDRGAVLGVASAAGAEAVHTDISRAGLDDVFTFVGTTVVDKRAFLADHRGDRARAAYVGDTVYDLRSARGAGYSAVAIVGGYQSAAALLAAEPDTVIGGFAELSAMLAKVAAG